MGYLVVVTVLWAFSFSLIGVYLAGQVDSYFAVMLRVSLAALVFLPLLKPRLLAGQQRLILMALGAVQLGVMYIFFYQSFLLLSVPEVLLFTIFTPLYIAVLDDLAFSRFTPFHLVTAGLAVLGAAVIRYHGVNEDFWLGFLVVQGANLCFALGQVGYRAAVRGASGGTAASQRVRLVLPWRCLCGATGLCPVGRQQQPAHDLDPMGRTAVAGAGCLRARLFPVEPGRRQGGRRSLGHHEQHADPRGPGREPGDLESRR